jgi:chemotaxis protein MotB
MKDKPSEWVSISDLMSSVVAVVVLLLVISVLQNQVAAESGEIVQREVVTKFLTELKNNLIKQGADSLVYIDINSQKIILPDNVFSSGSACVTPKAKEAVMLFQKDLITVLNTVKTTQVLVEGHTDNVPVQRPVIDYIKNCTVYDDNYTLSAARAREVRQLLVNSLNTEYSKRFIVAGYGDSHPLNGINPSDSKNRRVQIHFITQEK